MLIQARTKISIRGSNFAIKTSLLLLRIEVCSHDDCEYLQVFLNTISNLICKFTFKEILVNPDYATEIAELTGNKTVSCLFAHDGTMKEAKYFLKYLV